MHVKIQYMKSSKHEEPNASVRYRLRSIFFIFSILLIPIFAYRCSLEEGPNRGIRAHTENFGGVRHGFQSKKALRYCQHCHGAALQGGVDAQPSCFSCHGLNWDAKLDGSVSAAPDDHTEVSGGFSHHPGRGTPNSTCVNCHGSALEGGSTYESPSCYLCHDQKW